MAEKWIAGATKNKGALHKQMGIPLGQKIPLSKLKKAKKKKGSLLAKRANLAITLRGLKHALNGGK